MRLKLPMMGHGFGPGGRLSLVVRRRKWRAKRRSATVASHARTTL